MLVVIATHIDTQAPHPPYGTPLRYGINRPLIELKARAFCVHCQPAPLTKRPPAVTDTTIAYPWGVLYSEVASVKETERGRI